MNAADLLDRAERRAARFSQFRSALVYLVGAGLLAGAYCTGKAHGGSSERISQAKQEEKLADVARAAAVETVTVVHIATEKAAKRVDAARASVGVVDASTLAVQVTPNAPPLLVTVPAPVVERIVADSLLIIAQRVEIGALRALVVADSAAIRARDVHIRALEGDRPRFGLKTGLLAGAALVLSIVVAAK